MRKIRARFKQLALCGVFCAPMSVTMPVWSNEGFALPTLSSNQGLIETQRDQEIGEWALRELQQKAPLLDDPWVHDQLSHMLNNINAQARTTAPLALVIVKDPQINAFAVPGGLIGINTGLVTKARTADELASVLSHEIAHVSQRHFQRRSEQSQHDVLVRLGGLIASVALAKHSPEAASAVAVGSQAYTVDKNLAYSREHEREADYIGMQIMQSAGYEPSAMPTFFELMHQHNHHVGYVPSFALTHPLTEERITESRQRAQRLLQKKNYFTEQSKLQFPFIQWRILALKQHLNIAQFEQVANSRSTSNKAAQMGLVTAYIQKKNYKQAQVALNKLKKTYHDTSLYLLNQADIYIGLQRYADAVATLQKAMSLFPESRSVRLALGSALSLHGHAAQALSTVQPLAQTNPRDIIAWQVMQRIVAQDTPSVLNRIKALRYRAEVAFWKNNIDGALLLLARAKQLAKAEPSHLAKINARSKAMRLAKQ